MSQQELTRIAQPYHVTLTKNTKGYNWEVSVYAETTEDALAGLEHLQDQLAAKYGKKEEGLKESES